MRTILLVLWLMLASTSETVHAEAVVYEEYQETAKAEVIKIISTETRELPGLETEVRVQEVSAKLLSGDKQGETISFSNELAELEVGDRIFIDRRVTIDGKEYFIFKDVDRHMELLVLSILFVGIIAWFSRAHGLRALACLILSIGAIMFVLVPMLLAGYDPALTSLCIASVILATVLFGTHGVNPFSIIASLGTMSAVALTCLIAYIFVEAMSFTGFSSDAAIFLNLSTGGSLDFAGLLLGSIIIGMLGVLDDVSITQASVVAELKRANDELDAQELYRRATKVGRDHVASLVNTLALAYVGVSLPLILLLARADASIGLTLNQELVAVELARIMIGSIGVVLAVPATTAIAAWYFGKHGAKHSEHAHHHH